MDCIVLPIVLIIIIVIIIIIFGVNVVLHDAI